MAASTEEDDDDLAFASPWNDGYDYLGAAVDVPAQQVHLETQPEVPVMHHGVTTTTYTSERMPHHHDPLYEIDDVELGDFLMEAMVDEHGTAQDHQQHTNYDSNGYYVTEQLPPPPLLLPPPAATCGEELCASY